MIDVFPSEFFNYKNNQFINFCKEHKLCIYKLNNVFHLIIHELYFNKLSENELELEVLIKINNGKVIYFEKIEDLYVFEFEGSPCQEKIIEIIKNKLKELGQENINKSNNNIEIYY